MDEWKTKASIWIQAEETWNLHRIMGIPSTITWDNSKHSSNRIRLLLCSNNSIRRNNNNNYTRTCRHHRWRTTRFRCTLNRQVGNRSRNPSHRLRRTAAVRLDRGLGVLVQELLAALDNIISTVWSCQRANRVCTTTSVRISLVGIITRLLRYLMSACRNSRTIRRSNSIYNKIQNCIVDTRSKSFFSNRMMKKMGMLQLIRRLHRKRSSSNSWNNNNNNNNILRCWYVLGNRRRRTSTNAGWTRMQQRSNHSSKIMGRRARKNDRCRSAESKQRSNSCKEEWVVRSG